MHTAKEQISLIHRLASKRRVQFLSTQRLDLSSGGNYVQYEVDIPAERQNDWEIISEKTGGNNFH